MNVGRPGMKVLYPPEDIGYRKKEREKQLDRDVQSFFWYIFVCFMVWSLSEITNCWSVILLPIGVYLDAFVFER